MLHRTISTITLLAILFCAVYFGGIYGIVALATVVSALALFEYYRLAEHFGAMPRKTLGIGISALMIPSVFYTSSCDRFTSGLETLFLIVAAFVILYALFLMKTQRIPAAHKQLATTSGVIYLPFMISFFAILVGKYAMNGVLLCVWVLLATKFTDVGGLVVGCTLGKHKLAPNISPNKTWEGVAGGIVFSMLVGAGTIFAFNHFGLWELGENATLPADFAFPIWLAAVGAIPFAATSVVSDLVESVIKRQAGDKDSGHTIPGMGGALDLLDSLVLVAPVGYVVVKLVVLA